MKAYISSVYEEGYDDDTIIAEMMASADMNLDGEMDLNEFKIIMRSAPMKSDGALGGAVDATVGATVGGIRLLAMAPPFSCQPPSRPCQPPSRLGLHSVRWRAKMVATLWMRIWMRIWNRKIRSPQRRA